MTYLDRSKRKLAEIIEIATKQEARAYLEILQFMRKYEADPRFRETCDSQRSDAIGSAVQGAFDRVMSEARKRVLDPARTPETPQP